MWLAEVCGSPFFFSTYPALCIFSNLGDCNASLHHAQPPWWPSIQVAEIQPGARHCLTSGRARDPHLGTIEALNVILTAQNHIQVWHIVEYCLSAIHTTHVSYVVDYVPAVLLTPVHCCIQPAIFFCNICIGCDGYVSRCHRGKSFWQLLH